MTPRGDDDLPALDGEYLYRIRGQVVILDADIGRVFGKSTKAVNQNRARSAGRFPPDYAFQLTAEEWAELKSQFVTSTSHGGRRSAPLACSEQDCVMFTGAFVAILPEGFPFAPVTGLGLLASRGTQAP